MSTVKISELPVIPRLNEDTTQTLIAGVDVVAGVTGKMTAKVLAQSLYSHDTLNVGNNEVQLPNTVAQFAASSNNYVQVNLQNNEANGSADYVITADTGTDSTYYIDMGFNGSTYSYEGYTYAKPLDGYLVVQGEDNTTPGGNLVIGTTTAGKDVSVLVGSIDDSEIMAKFVANTGLKMIRYPYHFADGTSQNTAASPSSDTIAAFLKANSAYASQNVSGTYANTAYNKANSAGIYANGAFTQANVALEQIATQALGITSAQTYANGAFRQANAAFNTANSALANTTGTLAGALTITGNVIVGETIVFKDNTEMRYNPSASPASFLISSANSIQVKSGSKVFSFGNDGNFSVPRDLGVTGNTTIAGDLSLTNGTLSSSGNMTVNGTMVLANSNFTATESAITIKATANVSTPSNDGYMLHISGKQDVPSRIVFDSYSANGAAYGLVAGRTARGNVDYPAPVQSGDVLMRISGNGYGTSEFAPLGIARIDIVATETYTNSSRGSQIKFYNVENGSNTLVNIATFNANNVTFTGYVNPAKGVVYTPRLPQGAQTAITIDYTTDSVIKANCAADVTISHSNFVAGKIVEVWLVNTDNSNHTVTHGCAALRSTNKSTTATITAGSSMFLKFFSIAGDIANTFVSING